MSLVIRRTGAADYGRFIKMLLCGEPGAGKTLMSSTFPNPLYISAEGGLMSIADRNLPYIEVESVNDLLNIKNVLDQDREVRAEVLGIEIDTVVLDTIDEIQKIFIQERLKTEKKAAMVLQDWGWLNEQMQAVVRGFRNLDMHVVFTCHLKEQTDGDSGKSWVKPALQGGIADAIAGYVDLSVAIDAKLDTKVVGDSVQRVQSRTLHTFPTPRMSFLKDRSGKLPQEMEINFVDDFERIFNMVYANVDALAATEDVYDMSEKKEEPQLASESPQVEQKGAPAPGLADGNDSGDDNVEGFEYVMTDGTVVVSRNQLPDGVTPIPMGRGTNLFCEETGQEVESEDQADLSRIKFRKVLCREAFEERKKK